MFRRRRAAAPNFKTPMPFNPQTGQYAPLGQPPDVTDAAVFRIKTVYGDYLECEGWDPVIHGYVKTVNVGKPPLLRDSVERYVAERGTTTPVKKIRFPFFDDDTGLDSEYTAALTYEHAQQRKATYDDDLMNLPERVWPPYFPGDLIVASRVKGTVGRATVSPIVDTEGQVYKVSEYTAPEYAPMDMLWDDAGIPIFWLDLNISGRMWRADDGPLWAELEEDVTPTDTSCEAFLLGYDYPITISLKEPGGETMPHGYGRDGLLGPPRWHNGTFITVVPDWHNRRWQWGGSGFLTSFAGSPDGAIAPGASGAVHIWWQDWTVDPISLVAGPAVASAINVGGRTVGAGDWIRIDYDPGARVHYFQ